MHQVHDRPLCTVNSFSTALWGCKVSNTLSSAARVRSRGWCRKKETRLTRGKVLARGKLGGSWVSSASSREKMEAGASSGGGPADVEREGEGDQLQERREKRGRVGAREDAKGEVDVAGVQVSVDGAAPSVVAVAPAAAAAAVATTGQRTAVADVASASFQDDVSSSAPDAVTGAAVISSQRVSPWTSERWRHEHCGWV